MCEIKMAGRLGGKLQALQAAVDTAIKDGKTVFYYGIDKANGRDKTVYSHNAPAKSSAETVMNEIIQGICHGKH